MYRVGIVSVDNIAEVIGNMFIDVALFGILFGAVCLVLVGLCIWRTPHHEWEAERRKIRERHKRVKEFYSFFDSK